MMRLIFWTPSLMLKAPFGLQSLSARPRLPVTMKGLRREALQLCRPPCGVVRMMMWVMLWIVMCVMMLAIGDDVGAVDGGRW